MMHTIMPHLLCKPIKFAVIGCGGTGSAMLGGLPHLRQALVARGHPHGIDVTAYDGDRIGATNCVRQPFSGEIGFNRLNLFWGLEWKAEPEHVTKGYEISNQFDVVIGCVDSRAARAVIHQALTNTWCGIPYHLDIGNGFVTGQFVLGHAQPRE